MNVCKWPLYVVWEITLDCNARCLHCYSNAGPGVTHEEALSTDEAISIIDQLAEVGVFIIGFSGGEVLLHPDWHVLLGHALEKGIRVSLSTNGRKVDESIVNKLKELGVQNVTISLDGASPYTHERIRQVPGLFHDAIRAVTMLGEADIPVTVGFTPTKLNYREARNIVELAYRIGAPKVNLTEYLPVGRGGLELALSADELKTFLEQWLEMQEAYRGKIKITWHDCRVALLTNSNKYSGCGAGVTTCRITVNGNLTPCVSLLLSAGNLRARSFRDIWRNSDLLIKLRDRSNINEGNCGTCEHKTICGGCRSVSLAYHSNAFAGDPTCWLVPETPNSS